MNKRKVLLLVVLVSSIVVLSFGLISVKMDLLDGQWSILPYILVGVSCAAFGYSLGSIIKNKVLENNPDIAKTISIEKNDERNISLINAAKSKAFDAMIYVFGGVILILGLMNVALSTILLLVGAYLLVCGIYVYFMKKLQNAM